MRIRLSEIPDEGLDIEDEESIGAVTGGVADRVALSLRADKIGTEIRLTGKLRAGLNFECSRCLKPFVADTSIPVDLVFVPAEDIVRKEGHELASDEMNTGFYRGGELDMAEISGELVLLNIPMKPLCSESCRGICPVCGADLNERSCDCSERSGDERMQVLKKFFDRRNK